MRTENKQTIDLLSEKTHPIIELFFEYVQLKNLYRKGWLKQGVSEIDSETVADHSFGVAILGYSIAEEYRHDLDSLKVMRLGLFHDIGEVYTGDTTPADGISLENKFQRGYKAVKRVFSHLPHPDKYINIWLEFERQTSPEAVFVKEIDKLEMALQANLYEKMKYGDLDEFFANAQKNINSPELKIILADSLKIRKTDG